MARVLMVASEAAPFVKTGGLADVLGGLPPALKNAGEDVAVVLPKYRTVELAAPERVYQDLPIRVGGALFLVAIDRVLRDGVPYYFVVSPPLYDRDGIYNSAGRDFPDNHVRFAVLCRAAMEIARRIFRPQLIHCHDWQASLTAPYIRRLFRADPTFAGLKILLTIHNLGYQGIFSPRALGDLGFDLSMFTVDTLEYFGDVNLLKGGILFSDAVSTVSPAYAREIQTPEYGFGLDGLLRARGDRLFGILNGVDYRDWSPETDKLIPVNYGIGSIDRKAICKRALIDEFGLPQDDSGRPVIGIVSRFATQKGFDLIANVAGALADLDLYLVVLGSGDARYERIFLDLRERRPDRVGVKIGYDNPLAHRIEAGADMFLMPSQYEPCGLNQIYSLRYGAVPIVRATGGLDDTIDESTGFKFHQYSGTALLEALETALAAFKDKSRWRDIMHRGMEKDYSWSTSAIEYAALYRKLLAGAASGGA
jgi:starch synthase